MPVTTDANITAIRFAEQSGTPSTPAAGYSSIYLKSDGLYVIDDAGAVSGPLGTGDLTDAIILDPTSSTRNIILPTTGDFIPFIVRGYAGAQTANLFEAKEGSAGTNVFTLSGTGAAVFQNFTDSTSGFKILDKDGGTSIFNVDTTNERVGIGTDTPSWPLDIVGATKITADGDYYTFRVSETRTTTSSPYSVYVDTLYQPSSAPSSSEIIGIEMNFQYDTSENYAGIYRGIRSGVQVQDTGDMAEIRLFESYAGDNGGGDITSLYNYYVWQSWTSGAITNAYGFYCEDQDAATNNYSIYTNAGDVVINAANSAGNVTVGGAVVSANYDLGLVGDGVLMIKETATPTADTNYGKVYCKDDNKLYFQDGAGSEHEIAFAV